MIVTFPVNVGFVTIPTWTWLLVTVVSISFAVPANVNVSPVVNVSLVPMSALNVKSEVIPAIEAAKEELRVVSADV